MKRKLLFTLLLTIVMTMCFGMTAFASPKTMPDGTVFDAEYYAKTYPDVVSAIGTDENALYQHYVMAGKAEGRHPVAPAQTTESKPSANSSNLDKALVEIQNRFATGTVPTSHDIVNPNGWNIMKYNADDSIESYMQPIIDLCAKNGFKYLVCGNDSPSAFNGTCHTGNDGKEIYYYCLMSNTNTIVDHGYYDLGGEDIVCVSVSKNLVDYRTPGYMTANGTIVSQPKSHKKNDITIDMHYVGYYNKHYTIIGEIPVN